MPNLYLIDVALRNIIDLLESNGGEITPDIEADLDVLNLSREQAQQQLIAAYHERLSQAASFKTEAARITELRKAAEATAEAIRARLLASMLQSGEDKIVTPIGTAAIRINPPSVVLAREYEDDPTRLPPDWVRTETKYSANKKAIIAAAAAGETLPDGVTVVRAQRVEIK